MNIGVTMNVGDMIHQLVVVNELYKIHNEKLDINFEWDNSALDIFNDVKTFIESQPYCNSFNFRNTDSFNYQKSTIYLGDYIKSPLLYNTGWTHLLCQQFDVNVPNPAKWLFVDNITGWENTIVVYIKSNCVNKYFRWKELIDCYPQYKFIFVGYSDKEYNLFEYKNLMSYYKTNSMLELAQIINSCKLFIGNFASPLAIAHGLDINRLAILPEWPDAMHYYGDRDLTNKLYYFINEKFNNTQEINFL